MDARLYGNSLAYGSKTTVDIVSSQRYEPTERDVALLPAILLLVFGSIWFYDRSRGGFRAKRL